MRSRPVSAARSRGSGAALPAAMAAAALAFAACPAGGVVEHDETRRGLEAPAKADLARIGGARLFFGHQSVGYDILDGVEAVFREAGRPGPSIVETRVPTGAGPALFHATIGENGDPLGKIRDFEALVRGGMGASVDLAFMKLCYADIGAGTDAGAVFASYEGAMSRLRSDFPDVVFAYATVPLTSVERGPVALAKRLLGRPSRGQEDNKAREELNMMIRAGLPEGVPLFDIARFESLPASGARKAPGPGGTRGYALRAEYTRDGGHLGALGRKVVAGRLLADLAAALSSR